MDAEDPALQLQLQVWTPSQQPSPSQFPGSWSNTAAIPVETTSEQPSPTKFHGIWQTRTSVPIDVTALSQQHSHVRLVTQPKFSSHVIHNDGRDESMLVDNCEDFIEEDTQLERSNSDDGILTQN